MERVGVGFLCVAVACANVRAVSGGVEWVWVCGDILRFQAETMIMACVQWRAQVKADTILEGPPPDQRMTRALPAGFCGRGRSV